MFGNILAVEASGGDRRERDRAIGLLIIGLVLALTTPFLLPSGLAALFVSGMLVRRGHQRYAMAVLLPAVFALVFTVLALLER